MSDLTKEQVTQRLTSPATIFHISILEAKGLRQLLAYMERLEKAEELLCELARDGWMTPELRDTLNAFLKEQKP